ncbi:S8 family serine peptidase, partial [Candidatus Woesearchaeota archaeon]|nr:S8 family serine peptidase [Candidatus Woesearchaeota archaeon]
MKKGEALFGLILFLSVLVLAAGLLFPNSHESDLAGLAIDQSVANLAKLPKCTNASCVSPPSPFCNGSKLITYEIPGICASNKKCSYTKFSVDCPLGCNNGACVFKDVCSSDSILGTVDDGAASKPGTNSFALFVNPVVKNENTKYSLYFDKSIQVNTEKLTKQMGNAVSYSDNGVVLEFDAKNANPFMLTKFGDDNIRQASFDGYIIELVEEPIAKKKANIEKKVKKLKQDINELSDSEAASSANLNILNNKRSELDKIERSSEQELIAQESRIEQEQLKFIDDLSNVIEKKRKAKAEKPQRVQMVHAKKRFKNSFNGVFIQDVSEDELLEIKKLKTVKRITPNFRVSIDLQESVPIIRADKLWETGITGNGVGIGIIDTGVDYSHPDLNGCSGSGDSHAESTLKIGGRDYKVISSSGIGVNDFNIKVDISGDGVLPNFNLGDNFRDVIGSEKETITKDDYLFLKDFGMLQYKGADKITADNPLLKFKQLKTGNTTEQTYTNSSPLAKLKLGGYDYSVFAVSDMVFNDFDINADLDHSGYIDYGISIIADESKDIVKDNNFYLLDYDGLLQYLGADKATNDNPIMRFKNLQTGEIIEQSYAIISSGGGGGGGGNSSNTSIPSTEPTNPKTGGGFGSGCKVEGGYDFVNNDNDPIDDNGHGTHVAATAAGNGVLKGVAPDATIYAYKVLDSGGSGTFANIIAAIERSIDPNQDKNFSDHLDVISLSLGAYCGFYDEGCGPDDPLSTAMDNAVNEGVIAVVAAGNAGHSPGTIASPGTSRKAITVGASCKPNQIGSNPYCEQPIASFSSRGPVEWSGNIISKPDISAPGVAICAAEWDDAFSYAK